MRMGQYTGTSNASENVQKIAMTVARVDESLYLSVEKRGKRREARNH